MQRASKLLLAFALLCAIVLPAVLAQSDNLFEYSKVETLQVYAPAVRSSGGGALSRILVAVAYPGRGKVFFSALPYTEVETQGAARIAAYVASTIAGVSFSDYDYFVLVESDTPLIGGPSAGALMAVGFASLLANLSLNSSVTMTGMVNPDGTIGPVGGLKEKLEAAAAEGFKLFLIPKGQRIYQYPVYIERTLGRIIIRQVTYKTIDLVEYGKSLNVTVVEVGSVVEALYYFTGGRFSAQRSNIAAPGALASRLADYAVNVSRVVEGYAAKATILASNLPPYYRYSFLSTIESLNNTYRQYYGMLAEKPFYATYKLLDVLEGVAGVYYTLLLAGGDATSALNDVAELLNSTQQEVYSAACSLEDSLTSAQLYAAWLYYAYSANATSRSAASYLARSVRLAHESKLYYVVSGSSRTPLNCTRFHYVEAYSNVLAIYAYVERILEEAGLAPPEISTAGAYVEVLNYLYERGEPAIYGAGILASVYATASLHSAYGTQRLVVDLLGTVQQPATPLVTLFAETSREALASNDLETGALMAELAIFTTYAVRWAGMPSAGTEGRQEAAPTKNPSPTTSVVQETPTSQPQSPGMVEQAGSALALFVAVLLLVLVAVFAVLALYYFLKRLH